jgi:chromosome segregation ATPase
VRITRIEIDNLFSFTCFVWWPVDPCLNLIVGPNGAGKTNLFRALRLAVDALSSNHRPPIKLVIVIEWFRV